MYGLENVRLMFGEIKRANFHTYVPEIGVVWGRIVTNLSKIVLLVYRIYSSN